MRRRHLTPADGAGLSGESNAHPFADQFAHSRAEARTMATNPPSGMIGRIRAILMEPKAEWPRIDAEPSSVGGVFMGWVVPLAAIGPVAQLIGWFLFAR